MEIWLLVVTTLCIAALLRAFFNLLIFKPSLNLQPPGPTTFPIIGNILWLRKSASEIEPILRSLHAKYGPVITVRFGFRPAIFVADRSLAHQALVRNGSVFSNRPRPLATSKILNSNQHNISSSFYGPTWLLFRRNLASQVLHPSRVKSFSNARKWVLDILVDRIESEAKKEGRVVIKKHVQYAMFCLLVLMCFGDKLDEKQILKIERVERNMLVNLSRFSILNFWPRMTKIFLHKKWAELLRLREEQKEALLPIIRARIKFDEERLKRGADEVQDEYVLSYLDTLWKLELPEEKRKLNEDELISLCNEFLNAGTDTTSTALEWIMANLVKNPQIQEKLFTEIKGAMEDRDEVKEEDLQKMQYLKAVVLEGLRRHPPAHFVLPHAVTEDVQLGQYIIPKNGSINFMVADMGWDPNVWDNPMEFRPERFLRGGDGGFDITGSKEIKMMPFGVGRRICPGLGLALLHLEYFVANLVWKFDWKAVDGDDIDLSDKQEFTMVMKNPLKACIYSRIQN